MKNGTKLLIFNGKNDSAYALFNMIDIFNGAFLKKHYLIGVCCYLIA